ncbi:A/G-specific adenine glycosylase [bacterium]|nr:A/G-specific adenine glycosylase [bacterium]
MNARLASGDSGRLPLADRRAALLAWYDRHARRLPWRTDPSLYGTWISEIMLQQTTVMAVLPRYREFLARFPDVVALAAASEDEVLAAWTGLGYYRRARLLHRAARAIVERGGVLPTTRDAWRDLPGIGDYAAGAIASIGLGLVEPAVDANVRRVMTRWACADPDQSANLTARRIADLARRHVDPARPGDWNQALMDLGATICTSDRPRCGECPVARWCAAGQAGRAAEVPAPRPRDRAEEVVLGSLVIRHAGRVLLLPAGEATVLPVAGLGRARRRDLGDLLAATLCPPLTPWYAPHDDAGRRFEGAWARWLRARGLAGVEVRPAGEARHTITRYRLRILVHAVELEAPADLAGSAASWHGPDGRWPGSTLARRCLARGLSDDPPDRGKSVAK